MSDLQTIFNPIKDGVKSKLDEIKEISNLSQDNLKNLPTGTQIDLHELSKLINSAINDIQIGCFDIVDIFLSSQNNIITEAAKAAKAEATKAAETPVAAKAAKAAETPVAATAPVPAPAPVGGGGKKKQMPTTTSSLRRAKAPLYTINSGSSVVKEVLAYRFARNVLKRYYRTNKYMIEL